MDIVTKFTDLHTDVLVHILIICDYKSILFMNCTCKLLNNIDLETILITKSKRVIRDNIDHLIPRSIIFDKENSRSYDNMIIACLKYFLNNNIDLAYDDKILPDKRADSRGNIGCFGPIGFSGCMGIIITKHGIVITPTYKIFEKFLKFKLL
jgi:hypothetical protein